MHVPLSVTRRLKMRRQFTSIFVRSLDRLQVERICLLQHTPRHDCFHLKAHGLVTDPCNEDAR